MNLGEAKTRALSLMAEYSISGVVIPASRNADYLNRMNRFADDSQMEISDKIGINSSYTLQQAGSSQEGYNRYPLPDDFKENRFVNLNNVRSSGYRIENGILLIPKHFDGVIEHFYYKNPQEITASTPDSYEFEVERHTHRLIPYYMGGMAIHDENVQIADRLLNIYYSNLQKVFKKNDDFPNEILTIYTI